LVPRSLGAPRRSRNVSGSVRKQQETRTELKREDEVSVRIPDHSHSRCPFVLHTDSDSLYCTDTVGTSGASILSYFKDHLTRNSEAFHDQLTPAWKADEGQKEVQAAVGKDISKRVRQAHVTALCKYRIQLRPATCCRLIPEEKGKYSDSDARVVCGYLLLSNPEITYLNLAN
jgi:hypothetical protein